MKRVFKKIHFWYDSNILDHFFLVMIIASTAHILIVLLLLCLTDLSPFIASNFALLAASGIYFFGYYRRVSNISTDPGRAIRYFLLISFSTFMINILLITFLVRGELVPPIAAAILSAIIVQAVIFFVGRFFVSLGNNKVHLIPATSTRQNEIFLAALPLALGIIAFLIIVGSRGLNPLNIAWLQLGDAAANYLGWLFFRNSSWTFPIGLNPGYGLELSSFILYSDANPLLAFLFKLFSPLLPPTFQYIGLWLLVCFCLQAWFSWKLVGVISDSILIRLLGAGLFVFTPPMIVRIPEHSSLAAHFLITAALYITFQSNLTRRRFAWGLLLAITSMVHAYLLAMVVLIWLTDLARRAFKEKTSTWNELIIEFTVLLSVVCLVCWQVGYFSVNSGLSIGGFGFFRMNLLSILDSNGWSYLLKDISGGAGDYEGFNYLGLGVLFLFVIVIPVFFSTWKRLSGAVRRYSYLLILLISLSIYAITNTIGFGPLHVVYYYLPDFVLRFANIFRASGRMFWPVYYLIIFTIIFLVVNKYKKFSILLLSLAFILQVVDTSKGWRGIRSEMVKPSQTWNTPLSDSFWEEAAVRYQKVRYIPPGNLTPEWMNLGYFAGTQGLATDAVYLARIGSEAVANARSKAQDILKNDNFDHDTLYILDDNSFRQAVISVDKNSSLLAKIDGFNVVAPGWQSCEDCTPIESTITLSDLVPTLNLNERVLFNNQGNGVNYLVDGWFVSEDWGTWSSGSSANILFPIPPRQVDSIFIEANAFVPSAIENQRLTVTINGIPTADLVLKEPVAALDIKIPEAVKRELENETLEVRFNFPDAVSPKNIGLNNDPRELALGLIAVTIR